MNFKRYHVSKNLFDYQTMSVSKSGYALMADGSELSASQWSISDYIPINGSNFVLSKVGGNTFAICFYNANKQYVYGQAYATGDASSKQSIICNVGTEVQYARFSYISDTTSTLYDNIATIMFNTGSQPLPYEPYGNTWHDTPHYIHNTSTDTLTTLPADIYPNAETATVGLKGNMEQSGTPTPTTPIQPQEIGEKTGNLFDDFDIVGQVPSVTNGNLVNYNDGACTDLIELTSGLLTLSIYEAMVVYVFLYDANKSFLGWVNLSSTGTRTTQQISNYENAKYARVRTDNYSTYLNEKKVMLNTGSTALPYQPYGYKIPILSAGQTTPIYLGEVQSTRRIKKWVLDGTEDWLKGNYPPTGGYQFFASKPSDIANNPDWLTTHFKKGNGLNGSAFGSYLSLYPEASILPENASVNHFKAWLAAQYAAGTPVCVWYVLATPQTAVVNEPLMRIGDYADTVSNISIPVTAGGDTLSVDTTVQPSEVTVNYKGWHPVQNVHERDNGAWT